MDYTKIEAIVLLVLYTIGIVFLLVLLISMIYDALPHKNHIRISLDGSLMNIGLPILIILVIAYCVMQLFILFNRIAG